MNEDALVTPTLEPPKDLVITWVWTQVLTTSSST